MKCCNHNNKNHYGNKGHGHPMWMMILCCGAPIILLAVISLLGTASLGIRNVLVGILPFACPVMMLIMMFMMFIGGRKNRCDEDHAAPPRQIEEKTANTSTKGV